MGPLTEQSLKTLRATFDQYGHQPSVAMWCGIRSMVEHLERMANGTLAPIAYLSSLDPGVGKTEAVIHFVRALTASRRDVGVLICVSHLKEIASLADRMGLAKRPFTRPTMQRTRLDRMTSTPRRCSFSHSKWFPRGCQAAGVLAS